MPRATTATTTRTRRPPKRTWRWLVSYRHLPGDDFLTELPTFTQEDAEDQARALITRGFTDVNVIHVDRAGWRTPYPIATTEER